MKLVVQFAATAVLALVLAAPALAQADGRRGPQAPLERPRLTSLSGSVLAARHASVIRDMDAAAAFFEAARLRDPQNAELLAQAFHYQLGSGRLDEAFRTAERVLRVDTENRLARHVLAIQALRDGGFSRALQLLRLETPAAAGDLTGSILGAWAHHALGDTDEALKVLDRLRGAEWYAIFRDFHAGLMADRAQRRPEASRRFEAAFKLDQSALRVAEGYARFLARSGDRPRAIQIMTAFAQRLPGNPLVGAILADLNSTQPVQPMFRRSSQGAAEVLFGLGAALAREGGDQLGAIYLQLAVYLDPTHAYAFLTLADLYDQLQRPAEGAAALDRVPANSPLKRTAELQLAHTLDDLDRTEDALSHLRALIQRDQNDIEAWTTLGNVLRVRKRFGEAVEAYGRAVALVPNPQRQNWTLFFYYGIVLERSKRWPEAEANFQRALALEPDQPMVLNYLGYSWVDQNMRVEEALGMLRRAVEQRPTDGDIIDSVGWAYYRLGRYEEAVGWLERAVTQKPADPTINDHLGDAYWKVGRFLEARFQWRHARDLEPEPEELAKIEAKLRDGLPVPAALQTPASVPAPAAPARPNGG
jgi:tetratricopeptide (TPR) repeat protein